MAKSEIVNSIFSSMSKVEEPKKRSTDSKEVEKEAATKEARAVDLSNTETKEKPKTAEKKPVKEIKAADTVKKEQKIVKEEKNKQEYKRVNILVSEKMYEDMQIALRGHDNSMTTYLRDLIFDDLKKNLDRYKKLEERRNYY